LAIGRAVGDFRGHATILSMATEHIVALLIAERDKLNKAIEALSGPAKRRGRPPKNPVAIAAADDPTMPDWVTASAKTPARKKRTWSAAQKKAAAERMKARWAAKKKAEQKSKPKATRKSKETAAAA
jgi:hypothetical protein